MAGSGRRNADARLALALASGQTLVDAARSANVSERTARRRWKEAAFRELVSKLQLELLSQGVGKLASITARAAEVLSELLENGTEASEVGAARLILNSAVRLRDHAIMDGRLRELEEQQRRAQRRAGK